MVRNPNIRVEIFGFILFLGFLQFIESTTVAEVLETEGSILNHLRKHNPSETGPYGVSSHVIDSYIRSVGKNQAPSVI